MMKNNIFYYGEKLLGIAFIVMIALVASTITAFGVTIAVGAVVAGEPVTVENVKASATDLDTNYVSDQIVKMRPSLYPLDTMLRMIKKQVPVKSFTTEFYADDARGFSDTVKTAYTQSGDGQTSYDLEVNNVSMWSPHDTALFVGVTGVDSKDLLCYITSKNVSNGTIKIQPLNGPAGSGSTAGKVILPTSIPLNTIIVRCASAKNELAIQHAPYAIIPEKDYNYLQTYMAQVEEGIFQREHSKEVGIQFTDYEEQNIYDMRGAMENTHFFGYRALIYNLEDNSPVYFSNGVTRSISKVLTYGTGGDDREIDEATWIDWAKSIFTGNNGSEARFVFGGAGFTANMSKVPSVVKQQEAKKTEVKLGVTVKEIETNFGILYYKHHPGFDNNSVWTDRAVVLDLSYVEKHTWKPLEIIELDLIKAGTRRSNAVVLTETSCVVLKNPSAHAILMPKP